jgi:MYXO-CTERM domain-containing protein
VRGIRSSVAPLALALGLLAAAPGEASSDYPAEVTRQLSLSYTPDCAICHQNGVTGLGTVTTAFGEAMRAQGLVCCDIPSLDAALAALEEQDSPYIADLKKNLDPNDTNQSASSPLTYGCFNVTGQGPSAGAAVVFLLGLLVLRRRPRGYTSPSGPHARNRRQRPCRGPAAPRRGPSHNPSRGR